MLEGHRLVFDEFLTAPTATAPAYTDQSLQLWLGTADRRAIFAVVDSANASDTLHVQVEHSADGVNFFPKNGGGIEIEDPARCGFSPGTVTKVWGYDNGLITALEFVRLKVWFVTAASGTSAHVRIWVALRDPCWL